MVFAHASSKVVENLLRAAGAEGVWLCPGSARDFFPAVLCFHGLPGSLSVTFFDDLVILFEQNLTIFVHVASTLYLFPSWQHLGILKQLYVERL